ncbi:protein kinase domain-containing protein [Nocardia asiatica]|uniref:protein kinase domain-containing protein n=1 Tax=Nocardia asiatica TaxID=209252 RepID=UPI003EE411E8
MNHRTIRDDTGTAAVLPAGFSAVELLDDDVVATVTAIADRDGREAVLTLAKAPAPDQARTAFRRWAKGLLDISGGPHVARMIAADITPDGRPFLIVESGPVLADHLDEHGPFSVRSTRDLGIAIADALAAAHSVDIPHGALQPATILLPNDRPALAGFGMNAPGLAVAAAVDAYTPPEDLPAALAGRIVAGLAGDVYRLGVTLYVLLGGELPWQQALFDLAARSVALPEIPGVAAELVALLRAATTADPLARPSAAQLRDWLAGIVMIPSTARPAPSRVSCSRAAESARSDDAERHCLARPVSGRGQRRAPSPGPRLRVCRPCPRPSRCRISRRCSPRRQPPPVGCRSSPSWRSPSSR